MVAAIFAVRFVACALAHTCAEFFASFQSEFPVSRGDVSLLTEPSAGLRTSRKNDKN